MRWMRLMRRSCLMMPGVSTVVARLGGREDSERLHGLYSSVIFGKRAGCQCQDQKNAHCHGRLVEETCLSKNESSKQTSADQFSLLYPRPTPVYS